MFDGSLATCWLLATVVFVAVAMEAWACFVHRRLWHGVLYLTHQSHHRGPGDIAFVAQHSRGRWEFNDVFAFLHAALAIGLIAYGVPHRHEPLRILAAGTGLGATAYGFAYFVVHDGLVHGRLPVQGLLRFRFFRRVAAAHRVHHRLGGAPHGLFSGPWVLRQKKGATAPGAARAQG